MGVATSGGYDQARGIALRFVRAVRDGDRQQLERLLARRIVGLFPRLGRPTERRADVIRKIVNNPRRSALGSDVPLDQLIDTEELQVDPIARLYEDRPIPASMQGSDLRVVFPLRPQGNRWLHLLVGWRRQGGVVVRPGQEPRIVAL